MSSPLSPAQSYSRLLLRKKAVLLLLAVLLVLSFVTDISTGPAQLSFGDVLRAMFTPDKADTQLLVVVRIIRLPIALMALVTGAALALAGMEMQTILNNPLASPYTLGISSAASFGAALSLVFGASFLPVEVQDFATPVFAFSFSLLSSFGIYAVAKAKRDIHTVILAGIAVNFLFASLNSGMHYFVNDQILRSLSNWSQGNILGATFQKVAIIVVVVLLTTPLLVRESWRLTALSMGEETAASLGVRVESLRTRTLILTAVITSIAVCFTGTIGFVGLVAPYVAKALIGEEQRFTIPATLLTGSLMLSAASILSKALISNGQIPLGIITSIIGIPFLIWLILHEK